MSTDLKKNSNVAHVSCALDIGFFYKWLSFLTPFHKLTKSERMVLASFLNKRFQLLQLVRDENILDGLLKSIDIRKEIREDVDLTIPQFNILISKLKKSGVMKDNKIDKHYIPNIQVDTNQYRLVLIFDIDSRHEIEDDLRKQGDNGNVSDSIEKA